MQSESGLLPSGKPLVNHVGGPPSAPALGFTLNVPPVKVHRTELAMLLEHSSMQATFLKWESVLVEFHQESELQGQKNSKKKRKENVLDFGCELRIIWHKTRTSVML